MTAERTPAAASLLLRLLLERPVVPGDVERAGWSRIAEIALRNGVLLRVVRCLEGTGMLLTREVADAVARERRRVDRALDIVHRVGGICRREGVPFLFPKALQHLPDAGNDLDLLVGTSSAEIDAVLARELRLAPIRSGLLSRVAGAASYAVPDGPPLDIQHGRLGAVGEHVAFPARMLDRRRPRTIDGVEYHVPSPDDQLVLQGMQRVYGRRHIRLSDIVYTISTVARDPLDWDDIIDQSRRAGTLRGLGCYLSYADQLHRELVGRPLLDQCVAARLRLTGWGRMHFRGGFYRYPILRVGARLYPQSLGAQLVNGNWDGAGRLCLVPFLGAASAFGRRRAAPGA